MRIREETVSTRVLCWLFTNVSIHASLSLKDTGIHFANGVTCVISFSFINFVNGIISSLHPIAGSRLDGAASRINFPRTVEAKRRRERERERVLPLQERG